LTTLDTVATKRPVVLFIKEMYAYVCENDDVNRQSDPATRHGGAWGERRCSSYSFLTSALDGGEWSASRPGRALPPVPTIENAVVVYLNVRFSSGENYENHSG
jgi:hypothetical protein